MNVGTSVVIVAAERLNKGLVIKFSDGRCAFYSTDLLLAQIEQAERLDESGGT